MGKVLSVMPSKQQLASSLEGFPGLEGFPYPHPQYFPPQLCGQALALRTQTAAPLLAALQ